MAVGQTSGAWRHDGHYKRPWGHEKAGLDLRPAKNVLEVEWQGDESQALDRKRADRGGGGKGEDRSAKQVDRQHGRRRIRLSADQSPTEQHSGSKFNRYKPRPLVMGC